MTEASTSRTSARPRVAALVVALLLACALAPALADAPVSPPSSLGGGVARCSASFSYLGGTETSTSLTTSKATIEFEHDDVTEDDPDGCWSLPTADHAEFRFTEAGAVDVAFILLFSPTAKLTTTGTIVEQYVETRIGTSCVDGSGAVPVSKREFVNVAGASAGVLSAFTTWPTHAATVTLSDGERVCIDVALAASTDTYTIRHFDLTFIRRTP